jgi:hypothetical protein
MVSERYRYSRPRRKKHLLNTIHLQHAHVNHVLVNEEFSFNKERAFADIDKPSEDIQHY